MRNLSQYAKALTLLAPQAIAATTTSSAVDIEAYEDDALAIVNLGTFTSTPTVTITITGSLVATPTTYNQTLATFVAATAIGGAAQRINLAGIKNIKGVATVAGGTDPSVPVSMVALVTPAVKTSSLNSATLA